MLGPNDGPCCLDKPLGAAGSLTYSVNEDDARDDFGDTFVAGLLRRDLAVHVLETQLIEHLKRGLPEGGTFYLDTLVRDHGEGRLVSGYLSEGVTSVRPESHRRLRGHRYP